MDDLLASRPESAVKEYYHKLQKKLMTGLHEPLRCGDTQILLGREPTRAESGFSIKMNEDVLRSIVSLAGVEGSKNMKLHRQSHHASG